MKNQFKLTCCLLLALLGCYSTPLPEQVDYHDKRLAPFLAAVAAVHRDTLGFTPISEGARIMLEGSSKDYAAMLHIYGTISRTIAFDKKNEKYVWIGEQEIHTGPKKYTTPDGTFNETITLTFDTKPVTGVPLNKIDIVYNGPDSMLASKISLSDALRITKTWDSAQ